MGLTDKNYVVNALVDALASRIQNVAYADDLPTTLALLYLCDWKMCVDHGRTITDLTWHKGHLGPVADLDQKASKNHLDKKELDVVDHVANTFLELPNTEFFLILLSTFPLLSQYLYSELKLAELVIDYRQIQTSPPLAEELVAAE